MRLVALASLILGAVALLFYMQPRPRKAFGRSRSELQRAQPIPTAPVNGSIVDRFLFENSFGWEFARILAAFAPVAIGLIALWWLMRTML